METALTLKVNDMEIKTIAHDGLYWVAILDNGEIATAIFPERTWTQRTDSFGSLELCYIAYDGTYWAAVSSNGKLITSIDPTHTWTQRAPILVTNNIKSVAYGDGFWIAVAGDGKMFTTADPTDTWKLMKIPIRDEGEMGKIKTHSIYVKKKCAHAFFKEYDLKD